MKDFKTCMRGLMGMYRPVVVGRTTLVILVGCFRVFLSLSFVTMSKRLVDIATGVKDAPFLPGIVLFLLIILAMIASRLFLNWWDGYIIVKTQNEIREKTFEHVLRSRWSGKEKFLSGDTVNRLEEDIRVLADLICSRIPECVITVVQLLAASVYLTRLAPKLLWVLLALMVLTAFGSKLFFKELRKLTGHIRETDSKVQQLMQENLQNRVLVLTLTGVERVMERFGFLQEDIVRSNVKRLNYNALARGLMSLGFQAGYAAAFMWGVFGIKAGTVTYGMMTAFLQLVGQVQRPVADISRQIPAFIHALTSVERLMELDELEEESSDDRVLLEGAPEIVVDEITYSYPDSRETVLEGFSQTFDSGSFNVIIGETGAGKSTLIRVILGLLRPSRGAVLVDGYPAGPALRDNFVYVPQGNTLLSGTIRENLHLADPQATEEDMRQVLETASALFVYSLPDGLDTKCGEVGTGLSEGQSQRISVARSLLRKGGILILDEATSALDRQTEEALLENIYKRYHGKKTILFISHKEAVFRFADNVVSV